MFKLVLIDSNNETIHKREVGNWDSFAREKFGAMRRRLETKPHHCTLQLIDSGNGTLILEHKQ